ncbi:hypothetical protein ScPMuIL_000780 [Solemya velum]
MNYLPGTASLIEEIDKKLLVVLRDGRTLIGFLRSIDQFANLVLHKTIERIHVGQKYGDMPRGIFVVRGENVVLLGEIDLDNENSQPLEQVSIDEILELQHEEQQQKQEEDERKKKALSDRGIFLHSDVQDDYF